MNEFLVAVSVAGGFGAGAGAALLPWRSDRLLRQRLREPVIANMKTGIAFRGVLFEADGRSLVLRNAQAIRPGDDALTPVDGEVFLPRADVEFLQRA